MYSRPFASYSNQHVSAEDILLASSCKFLLICNYTVIVASKSCGNEKEASMAPC